MIRPGAFGDVAISDVDPIENITTFANHRAALTHVIHNGRAVVDRTAR